MDAVELSNDLTVERFNRSQQRIIRDLGDGATAGAVGLTKTYAGTLAEHIRKTTENVGSLSGQTEGDEKALIRVLQYLSPEVIAVAGLRAVLSSVALGENHRDTCIGLGQALARECWAAGLLKSAQAIARRSGKKMRAADVIEKVEQAGKRRARLKSRQAAAEALATKLGYAAKHWSDVEHLKAGNWLLNQILEALPNIIHMEREGQPVYRSNRLLAVNQIAYPAITEGALAEAEIAVEEALRRHPVLVPCTVRPAPWTAMDRGGYWDEASRLHTSAVRTVYPATQGDVKSAIRRGQMRPALDAVNRAQDVAWTINTPILEVLRWAYDRAVPVEGLPPLKSLELPKKPEDLETNEEAATLYWYNFHRTKEKNRGYDCDRVLFAQDMAMADLLAEHERFWTPMNLDWRGRLYAVPHFNFQRDDRVRALFLFADGAPIGREGLWWLKVHVANCGAFGGIDKQPMQARVQWCDDNQDLIRRIAADPKECLEWTKADKPFLFLAACMDLHSALAAGPTYVTRLPVSWDGSCSGLQHLCAMTRAPEGHLVNLAPSDRPSDIYAVVAANVQRRVQADRGGPKDDLARKCLAYGITRKLVKRNVMTYSYSSKRFGMCQQLRDDFMRPLMFEVLEGKHDAHPFGEDNGKAASLYLAGHVYAAIEEVVHLPAQAMHFLQECVAVLADEGKALTWTTPLGLPWSNRYYVPQVNRVSLWLQDAPISVKTANGVTPELATHRMVNGVAPNFVHACDATHLLMVVNAAHAEGITNVATVHDSFGCLAPQAARFNAIIREQFVRLYREHDVLAEVLDAAKRDLTLHNQQKLPAIPAYGPLNLEDVLHAQYAFA